MNDGYIKLYRSMTDWEWYRDANASRVFIHLLLLANHAEARWQGITIRPGQLATSSDSIAKALKLKRQSVRTAIIHLKLTNEITTQSTNKYTLITILKWALYQNTASGITSRSTDKSPHKQPATNQQLTTNKNDKKDKNEKNSVSDADFELFWSAYPRKKGKITALKCWTARVREGHQSGDLISAAQRYAAEASGKEEQFIKLPATFLGVNKPFADYSGPAAPEVVPACSEEIPEEYTRPWACLTESEEDEQ